MSRDLGNLVFFPDRPLRRRPRLSKKQRDVLAKLHLAIRDRLCEALDKALDDLLDANRAVGIKEPLRETVRELQVAFAEWVEIVWQEDPLEGAAQ